MYNHKFGVHWYKLLFCLRLSVGRPQINYITECAHVLEILPRTTRLDQTPIRVNRIEIVLRRVPPQPGNKRRN